MSVGIQNLGESSFMSQYSRLRDFHPKISGTDMQVIDYEPLTWFLLQYDGALFPDIPPNRSTDAA